ncbi:DNA-binding protein WhiA [Corynebacterium breve]|uniref:Probable cell division protein WhiA n=1 Tax=Corynebacterium breve TaxID=3049799 RepID=A0ABY8VGU7_9CORY|nr:DNA-binding protein WhiA [Corynebacterium breve]WIM68896.1 DNA-binding protein WhiA [Corynebacterium breve]
MALTEKAKSELLAARSSSQDSRAAEATAMIRYAGEISQGIQGLAITADFDDRQIAEHLATLLEEVHPAKITVTTLAPGATNRETRHQVKVVDGAEELIRRLKLVTSSGHPVVGLPREVISGTISDVEGAWRGAFLARGILSEPGRTTTLEVVCPRQEAALALVGLARRLGVTAKTKESRGIERVVVRDGDAIGVLLTRIGAQRTRLEWDEKRRKRAAKNQGSRSIVFDDANLRRSAQAAAAAAARVKRAMEILGDDVPEHLAEAGYLRVQHRHASLEELGRLADPQMTKDAVAGRIRRLLSMADKRAADLGIPDTHAAVTDDSVDEV